MNEKATKRKAAGAGGVSLPATQEHEQLMAILQTLLALLQGIHEMTQAMNISTQEIALALRTVTQEKEEREQEGQAQTSKHEERDLENGKDAAPSPSFYRGQWVGPQPIILRERRAQQPQLQPEEEEVHS